MPASSQDGSSWLDPKWFVVGVALVVFGLVISYDVRLGMSVGVLLAAAMLVGLYLTLRYRPHNKAKSGRSVLVERVRQQASNRRSAAAQMARVATVPVPAPVAAVAPLGPQQGPNPPQRP